MRGNSELTSSQGTRIVQRRVEAKESGRGVDEVAIPFEAVCRSEDLH